MSYEICVMDAALAPTLAAASSAWEASTYWDASLPDHERPARKWHISDGLLAFNPELQRMDLATQDSGGWFGKLKRTEREVRRYHVVSLLHGDAITHFTVFDQAVEIEFAYDAHVDQAPKIAREAWRHLQALVDMGLTTVFDTERNALLDLNTDFETVLAGYVAKLTHDAQIDAAGSAAAAPPPPRGDEPILFTGNVEVKKPWWKIW